MTRLLVPPAEVDRQFANIRSTQFQSGRRSCWEVVPDGDGYRVRARSFCWLFCWAVGEVRVGSPPGTARHSARVIFDSAFPILCKDFDVGDNHNWALAARYRQDAWVEYELAARLRQIVQSAPDTTDQPLPAVGIERDFSSNRPLEESGVEVAGLNEDLEEEYIEGRELLQLHRRKERNRKAVLRKKQRVLEAQGKLSCEVCDFDFAKIYGPLGEGFAECHHRIPLADLTEQDRLQLRELAIVCANCHRMLHRRPMHTVERLREIVKKGSGKL